MLSYKDKNYNCPIEYTLAVIGGKWKVKILWFLGEKIRRFGELGDLLPDTSRKVLIQQLKELESDGLVNRTVYPQVPPKVEYSLTEQGQSLLVIFLSLRSWGEQHFQFRNDNREMSKDCYLQDYLSKNN